MFDLEKLDNLPSKISIRRDLINRYGNTWNIRLDYRHWSNEPWKTINYIIENNIGKSFDMTYHYICKKIKPEFQYMFFDKFYNWRIEYYIDNNGNIQKINRKEYKKIISIRSIDYKRELIHKETGHKFDDFDQYWSKKKVSYKYKKADGTFGIREYNENHALIGYRYKKRYIAQIEDFEWVVTSGEETILTSKNDYRYIRNHYNEIKSKKALERRNTLNKEEKEQKFREILNRNKIIDKEKNDIIMIKKGFDPETSFRYGN